MWSLGKRKVGGRKTRLNSKMDKVVFGKRTYDGGNQPQKCLNKIMCTKCVVSRTTTLSWTRVNIQHYCDYGTSKIQLNDLISQIVVNGRSVVVQSLQVHKYDFTTLMC